MRRTTLSPEVLALIADRFKALGEPARLEVLSTLRRGERTVTQIVEHTGLGQGNVSKHLHLLHAAGFVARRKEGLHVFYSLTDGFVFRLCDITCDRLSDDARSLRRLLAS